MTAATVCFLWVASASAQPTCTDDYTGPGGGDWGTPANWTSPTNSSSHNVPTMTDVACVPSGTTVDVESNEADEAESIQGGGNLTMSGVEPHIGELILYGPEPSNIGDLTLTGGILSGDSISMSGNFDWNVASGDESLLEMVNGITQSGGGSFTISGSGSATDRGGAISTSSPVSITNVTGLGSNSADGANPSLTTSGVVTLSAGDYTGGGIPISAGGFDTTASTTYPNSLTVTGNTSDLAGSLSLSGATLTASAGSSLTVPTGVELSPTSALIYGTITGAGTYATAGGGTYVKSAGTLSTADVDISTGSVIVESGGDYAAGAGAGTGTTISGGTLSSDSGATATTVGLTFSSGGLNGGGTLTISGEFAWTGGTVSNTSPISLTQTGGGTFSISAGGEPMIDGGSISTTSPISITNTSLVGNDSSGTATLTTANVVTLASGTYSGSGVAGSLAIAAAGFDLSGTTNLRPISLVQTGGTTDVPVGETLTTAGTFKLQGGVLQVDGRLAGAFAAANPDSLSITGGTLEGSGAVAVPVTNTSGTVSPGDAPGTLTLDEGYTQGSGATLVIAVDGTATGEFSALHVEGEVSLDGTLALQPSKGYAASAAPGGTIAFLPYSGSLTGTFASTTVAPPLQAGESFAAAYGNAGVVDAVVGAAQPPSSSGLPVISGNDQQADVLSTTNGQWTNSPSSFTYQWEDCTTDSTSSCTAIQGAMSSSYTLTAGDVGDYVTVVVTAHNAAPSTGSATATPQGPVMPPVSSQTGAPATTGSPTVGDTSVSGLLAIAGMVNVSSKGVAAVSVSCSGATGVTCVGRLALTARVKTKVKRKINGHLKTVTKTKTLMFGSVSYSLAAGHSATLPIKLSKSDVKLLDAASGHKLTAVVFTQPNIGVTATKSVTLIATPVKKHKK